MPFFKRSNNWETMDMEEFDGLITLHGVLCAFLLSIAIELQTSTNYENQQRATFLGVLAYEKTFRDYVHMILSETMPNYQWNVTVSPGVKMDLEYELLHGISKRFESNPVPCYLNCLERDIGLATVVTYIFPDFPSKYIEGYLIHNPTHYRATNTSSYFAAAGSALLFGGLVSNVIIYLAFVVSSAKEDPAVGKSFKKIVLWVVFFAYAQLLFSIYCMGYAKSYSSTHNSPFAAGDWYIHEVFFPCVAFLPAVGITLPAVIYAYFTSAKKGRTVGQATTESTINKHTNTSDDRNSIDSQ